MPRTKDTEGKSSPLKHFGYSEKVEIVGDVRVSGFGMPIFTVGLLFLWLFVDFLFGGEPSLHQALMHNLTNGNVGCIEESKC